MDINFGYIHRLHYFLLSRSDDELDLFFINDKGSREQLYQEMRKEFVKFGPVSKKKVLDALEYVWATKDFSEYWRYILPQEVPLDFVEDKKQFLHDLFFELAGREPSSQFDIAGCHVVDDLGLHGLDVRE